MNEPIEHESYPDEHHDSYSKTVFGFWLYILSDFIFFGVLFSVAALFRNATYGGPSAKELFSLPLALWQTIILLTASFTIGLGGAAAHRRDRKKTLIFFGATFLLGTIFFILGIHDFSRLLSLGADWKGSAFLSSYFTLVGIHMAHMIFALFWTLVLLPSVSFYGLTGGSIRRLTCLRMFWQFLNIVWIFIFSFVYLLGVK